MRRSSPPTGRLGALLTGLVLAAALGAPAGCASSPEHRPTTSARRSSTPVVAAATTEPPPPPEPPPGPPPSASMFAPIVFTRAPGNDPEAGVVPPPPPNAMYRVKGLTGTLNTDDVFQTMDARQRELDACISQVRRREAYVHGAIRFALAIDAAGRVTQARTLASDIGHFALERCITEVVASTQFPEPDGDATAKVEWGMQVLGAFEPSDPMDAGPLSVMLAKRWAKLRERCELKRGRGRARNQVTLYVGIGGRVLSVGLVPATEQEDEKLECALEGLRDWRMPKPKRRSKLTFAMR